MIILIMVFFFFFLFLLTEFAQVGKQDSTVTKLVIHLWRRFPKFPKSGKFPFV